MMYLVDDYEFTRDELEEFIWDFIVENEYFNKLPYDIRKIKTPSLMERKVKARAWKMAQWFEFTVNIF